ncbi:DUF222 domain-containing protein [Gordonia sp. ABSL1-1]|uniref:HNH endonuclease signature motif containing protein n=1 Tax=Gordonia sp. ABSL1-1 TaxID=3053923 RepID=UPI0025737D5D|nr:HNH endonuclease signature motif containing protein [Gordonia sp. ABSL1-1]MDL9936737.1 DUF222 domain-containing protein [Gordonia sp. ABSL1-1]
MSSLTGVSFDPDHAGELYAQLHVLLDQIDALDTTPTSDVGVARIATEHERAARRMASIGHRRVMDVSDRAAYRSVGAASLRQFMDDQLRITDIRRRMEQMSAVSTMTSLQGETLPPPRPHLAEAMAQGAIGPGHVQAVLDVLKKIPAAVPADIRDAAEAEIVGHARDYNPKIITQLGVRLLAHLDPDGSLTDDRDRARRRGVSLNDQDPQLMSKISGQLNPLTRAMLDTVLAAWAAKGMNNPDDEAPLHGSADDISSEELTEAAERDQRSTAQRNHDALAALLRAALDGGLLGASNHGLPPHVIVKITEHELHERAGIGRTATGTDLPIKDVIELAARAQMHLAVFAGHTNQPLYLGTARRLASRAQRFMLFAHHDGCTCPGCTVPAVFVQIHHALADWADGGTTDIDTLTPACGRHNRMVGPEPGQYTTTVITDGPDAGRTAWTLNNQTGAPANPARINRAHDPGERLKRARRKLDSPGPAEKTEPPPPDDLHDLHDRRLIAAGWRVNRLHLPQSA